MKKIYNTPMTDEIRIDSADLMQEVVMSTGTSVPNVGGDAPARGVAID